MSDRNETTGKMYPCSCQKTVKISVITTDALRFAVLLLWPRIAKNFRNCNETEFVAFRPFFLMK